MSATTLRKRSNLRITAILLALLVTAGEARSPTFEVASVKPSTPNSNFSTWSYGPGATVRFLNVGLRPIIADAHDLDMTAATEGASTGSSAEGHAPVFVDAIRQDLGLRITPTNGPFDVLLIDSMEMPSAN